MKLQSLLALFLTISLLAPIAAQQPAQQPTKQDLVTIDAAEPGRERRNGDHFLKAQANSQLVCAF